MIVERMVHLRCFMFQGVVITSMSPKWCRSPSKAAASDSEGNKSVCFWRLNRSSSNTSAGMPSLSKAKPESWVLVTIPRMFTKIHLWSDYEPKNKSSISGSATLSALIPHRALEGIVPNYVVRRVIARVTCQLSRSLCAYSRGDAAVQKAEPSQRFTKSALGQKPTSERALPMSALPPKADILRGWRRGLLSVKSGHKLRSCLNGRHIELVACECCHAYQTIRVRPNCNVAAKFLGSEHVTWALAATKR